MSRIPLMPKATAVWLVENTGLTFRQIADFCHLHELEVKGIADGDVAAGIKGMDPVTGGQLTREEIEKGEKDPEYRLKILESKVNIQVQKATSGPRYTPVSRRGDRPDAIAWFLRHHPEVTDAQISKLIGTTKSTIESVRSRQHWNAPNLKPVDPVTLGLCSQIELDAIVSRAAAKKANAREEKDARLSGPTLRKVVTPAPAAAGAATADGEEPRRENITAEQLFANFGKKKDGEE